MMATAPTFSPPPTSPVLPGTATIPYPGAEATTATPIPNLAIPAVPVAGVTPGTPVPALPAGPPAPGITVNPSQVVAPIGSEVVMIASIMGDQGYRLTREKVEWMLEPNGPGQFVSPGKRRPWEFLDCLHRYPKKVSPVYAINRTLTGPMTIDRGTPTPIDDIRVEDGQAWVSVTSATEGTSHVTVFAPNVKGWDRRQQSATIYWVDAQWRFPPPAITPIGGRSTLTTLVSRQSDGSPLAGWIVRYEVVGGPSAGFSPSGSPTIEVVSNGAGEAPAEIFQQSAAPGTNQIAISILRPATADVQGRQVPVGSGSTLQSWTTGDASAPYSPPAQGPSPFVPVMPTTPTPTLPPTTMPPITSPPITSAPSEQPMPPPPVAEPQTTTPVPSGQPELTVNVNLPPLAVVGSDAQFEIVVQNRGNATATGLLIKDKFDEGLEHSSNPPARSIERNLTDLHPGETTRLPVVFRIAREGELCQDVTVTATNHAPVTSRACVTATTSPLPPATDPLTAEPTPREPTPPPIEPAPAEPQPTEPQPTLPAEPSPTPASPQLTVTKRGPQQGRVGDTVSFEIEVTNNTNQTFTDVTIADNHEISLTPVRATGGSEWLEGNALGWRVATIQPGRTIRREIELKCLRETPRACNRVMVTARGMDAVADEACLEISGDGTPPPAAAPEEPVGAAKITVSVVETADPIRIGGQTGYQIIVTNGGDASAFDVVVTATFDEGLQLLQHGGPTIASASKTGVRYPALRELRAGETQTFDLRFKGVATGNARVQAEITARGLAQPIRAEQTTEVLP